MSYLISIAREIAHFAVVVLVGLVLVVAFVEGKERLKIYRTRNWIRTHAAAQDIRQRPAQEVSKLKKDGWAIEFEYHYEVNGNKYAKRDHMIWGWKSLADKIAEGIAVKGINIKFDPDDPASSVFYLDEVYDEFNKS